MDSEANSNNWVEVVINAEGQLQAVSDLLATGSHQHVGHIQADFGEQLMTRLLHEAQEAASRCSSTSVRSHTQTMSSSPKSPPPSPQLITMTTTDWLPTANPGERPSYPDIITGSQICSPPVWPYSSTGWSIRRTALFRLLSGRGCNATHSVMTNINNDLDKRDDDYERAASSTSLLLHNIPALLVSHAVSFLLGAAVMFVLVKKYSSPALLEILDSRGDRSLVVYKDIPPNFSIEQLKQRFAKSKPKFYEDRQSFRLEPRGRMLKDSDTLQSLGISRSGPAKLYFKDLGPQIGWTTVFFCEYAGPLLVYLIFYTRPALIYANSQSKPHWVVQVAMLCWCGHYLKRIFETLFVHRFSHGTMPLRNLFKNCGYYWGFAAYVAYYTNHPLYTPPIYGDVQIWSALGVFLFSELGNFSIHLALRNLRPAGSKERRIPFPTANPFTWLFSLVSCPNYTYEVMSWLGFTAMTQCIPAGLFALAGFYQMAVWALGKHRNYKREFPNYPRRKAIIPFLL